MPDITNPNDPAWTPATSWENIIYFDSEADLSQISRQPDQINPNTGECCMFTVSNSWLKPTRTYQGYCRYPYNDECHAWKYTSVVYGAIHFRLVGGITGYWSGGYWWLLGSFPGVTLYSYENYYLEKSFHRYKVVVSGETIYDLSEGVIYFDGPSRLIKLFDANGNLVLEKQVSMKSSTLLFTSRARYVSTLGGAGSTWMEVDWVAWNETAPKPPSSFEFVMTTKVSVVREGASEPLVNILHSTPLISWFSRDSRIKHAYVYINLMGSKGSKCSNKVWISEGTQRVMLEVPTDSVEVSPNSLIINDYVSGLGTTPYFNVYPDKVYVVVTKSSVPHYVNITDAVGNKLLDDIPVSEDLNQDGYYESSFGLIPSSSGTVCVYAEAFDGLSTVYVYVIEVTKDFLQDAELVVEEMPSI